MKSLLRVRLGALGLLGDPRRLGATLLTSLLALVAFVTPVVAANPAADDMATSGLAAVVQRFDFAEPDETLGHNIPDLLVSVGDSEVACNFLTYYQTTGDVTRWGYATSEVIAERPGSLTQFFQRGIVDCQERDGVWRVERRLVWDYLAGGLGDAPDLGTEPDLLSEQPGLPLGPWGHRVSNLAVDGTPTGFLDFFNALGGLQAFGHPKSEARLDDAPGAMLGIEGADPGVIRQYFQAAVFESRPGEAEPVQLRFLGDAARNALYPFGSHQAFQSFRSAAPLRYGQTYAAEGTSVRDALVVLYHAAGGDNWNNNENWLSDEPLGEWHGVTTDDGRVIDLDLSENQLSGEIPAQVGRLTDLAGLSLWGNQLQGEIPPTIGSLDNVTHLSLWANQLRGAIPAELGDMASLEWVALGINELTGEIPPELGNLANLSHVDFTLNQLSGEIPTELSNLTNLVWLGFWSNQLSGAIPPELGNLTNLTRLDLDHNNRLSGAIPPELGNPVKLRVLYLRVNRLSGGIPPELGNLTDLTVLGLEQNQLTGEIPAELGNLVNLSTLLLAGNQLTGCAPTAFEVVPDSDLDELGLPFCEAVEDPPAGV